MPILWAAGAFLLRNDCGRCNITGKAAMPLRSCPTSHFYTASMAKHPPDVAVAWWSRPDEPASRNKPQSKETY